jgi:hypothetical protein
MELKVEKTTIFEKVRIEEGLHEAVLTEVKDISKGKDKEGNEYDRVALVFNVRQKELAYVCSKKVTPETKLGVALKALGADVDNSITIMTENYIGKICKVMVEDYTKDGETVSGITKVKPLADTQNV